MNISLIREVVGYTGLVINLLSMSCAQEKNLRMLSMVANAIYISYGVLLGAVPIIIGGTIAVLIHLYRLYHLVISKKEFTNSN